MANIPELVYLMMGASCVGAVINFVCSAFEEGCLKENIENNNKLLVISDDFFEDFMKKVSIDSFETCCLISLSNSLPRGENPYYEYDKEYCDFHRDYSEEISKNERLCSYRDFIKKGKGYAGSYEDTTVGLDTEFTVTYTSGSTKVGWPKAIVHTNRSYVSIGRFHDPDLSRMPAMRDMRGLAHIPTHSNTNLVSSISDPMMQTCTVACEPVYNKKFFARSLAINKPGFAPATRSFWIEAVKQIEKDKLLLDIDMSELVNACSVGEDISKNEERFINECFKKHKAGSKALPGILGNTVISVGGGNCEHGGLFFTLLKGKREIFTEDFGLVPFQLVDMAILHPDGTECAYDELGLLVANSVCTMKSYKNNNQATENFFIKDSYGKIWGNCNVWAKIDKKGRVHMRGRVGNETTMCGRTIPLFQFSDAILKDTRALSCETVKSKNGTIISYVELFPDEDTSQQIAFELRRRIEEKLELHDLKHFEIRFVSSETSYELTKSGKRNVAYLENLEV